MIVQFARFDTHSPRTDWGGFNMGGKIGLPELILIVGIALLLFGPSKFASLGKSLGEGLRNFKSAMKEEEGPKKKEEEEEKKS